MELEKEKCYSRTAEFDEFKAEYFVVKGEGKSYGVGVSEMKSDGTLTEDIACDVFATLTEAEEFIVTLASHTVLSVSLREILCDYFVGKVLEIT